MMSISIYLRPVQPFRHFIQSIDLFINQSRYLSILYYIIKMTEPIAPIEQQQQKPTPQANTQAISNTQVNLPRITIKYCTQCKWMLRAAYVMPHSSNKIKSLKYCNQYVRTDE